jgi:Cof subfamily protein (haloacid dehalogenase superfamily)
MMLPQLMAFDLDGTLLTNEKRISEKNRLALLEMSSMGIRVALASGRLGSSMTRVLENTGIDPAMMTLNGAMVYNGPVNRSNLVYSAPLPSQYADELVGFAREKEFAVNFYIDDKLHSVKNEKTAPWIDVYHGQTRTEYVFVDDLTMFSGRSPSKLIYVGPEHVIDDMEKRFRELWAGKVYVCRSWHYYLEFLSIKANKALGLKALADSCGIDMSRVAAFGDEENDIPMLETCGLGIAMKNGSVKAKAAASRVTEYSNDEDGVAMEWERIKRENK